MNKIILISLSLIALNGWAAKTAPTCAVCSQVDALVKMNDEDEGKAYKGFNELVGTVKLSSNKKVLAAELKSIVSATPMFLKTDERRELPSYLVDMQDAHPKEFAQALGGLSNEDKEDLERKLQAAKKNMTEGEEP